MSKTILTVDDSPSMRQMVAFTLGRAGYKMVEASDGQDGLAKFIQCPADLVITDLNMPRLNGIELIRQLRATAAGKYIPILMLTTESETDKKMAGKAAGATGWIVKPFGPDQLTAVVKRVLP